jgi:hypothetical protein
MAVLMKKSEAVAVLYNIHIVSRHPLNVSRPEVCVITSPTIDMAPSPQLRWVGTDPGHTDTACHRGWMSVLRSHF